MGNERHKRIWPHGADRSVTVKATREQIIRWSDAARIGTSKPHLASWLARAADFYAERLKARRDLALRLDREGKL